MTGSLTIGNEEFPVTIGTSTSHSTFLAGDLTDAGDCSMGVTETKTDQKLGSQTAQEACDMLDTEEFAKINDLNGIITFDIGITTKIGDLRLMDSMEGTYM